MRILLVDNYDSFTYNLAHLIAEVFGCEPHVVPNDADWTAVLARGPFDAAVISPGPGRPDRAADFGISTRVLEELRVPILGVCLGHQGICTFFGGSVVHAPSPVHGRMSKVLHDGTGLFAGIPSPFDAVRYHSLICAEPLPAGVRATAWTEDGIVMALAHEARPIWGVQFHPESVSTEYGHRLMENFREVVLASGARAESAAEVAPVSAAHVRPRCNAAAIVRRIATPKRSDEIFRQLFGDLPYAFWLDSSGPDASAARFSFMGGFTREDVEFVRYSVVDRMIEVGRGTKVERQTGDLFTYLQSRIATAPMTDVELPFAFGPGLVGYFGYELKELCGSAAQHRSDHPDSYLLSVDRFVAVDHETAEVYIVAVEEQSGEPLEWVHRVEQTIRQGSSVACAETRDEAMQFTASRSKADYIEDIERCLTEITDGETYEVCLTNRLTAETGIDPLDYYLALREVNPSPYGAFLRYPELSVACSSPERFLKISVDGAVESKPIKGTARRGQTPEEDDRLKRQLAEGEKNRSENLMIADLLRNDLSRVCEVGSVRVPHLMAVETYATMHQLVSTITGQLRPEYTAVDCLRAAFPGGSMTGAPKLRTMAIIDKLETRPRGIYSGAIGFLADSGAAELNIVIRTAVFSKGQVEIGVGGAIVALSEPEAEWEETLLKARALLEAFRRVAKSVELVTEHTGNTLANPPPNLSPKPARTNRR